MHLIVGIDTGKTMAYSCFDLDGMHVVSSHRASKGMDWLISEINRIGVPSIIACDKVPNEVVRKVGAAFHARVFYPKKEMAVVEKREMTEQFGITNPHERDACSAAVKAYNAYSNKLKQAEHIAKAQHILELDAIKAKVIEKHSIDEAISKKEVHRK